ncbi:prepilin peptidase-dependent pilin [Providencia sp. PROV149]|uniref:prepilin peptidase-dependent pilin n=1 Tax=Providencia sp. PROV149 TaxID=2949859 RepID=UPI0023491701|nr:prepilin peptidase-dependent pilin [Providencia sp. PROV149]
MNQKGFSLIEIMVVIAIISILSAIAIPGYQGYMQKAAITDVLQTILPYKNNIEICAFNRGTLAACNAGSKNIPNNIKGKYIKNIDVASGVINFTADKNLDSLSVTLTPTVPTDSSPFQWQVICESSNDNKLKTLCENTFVF